MRKQPLKTASLIVSACLIAATPVTSQAFFRQTNARSAPAGHGAALKQAKHVLNAGAVLAQVGTGTAVPVNGFAQSLPLKQALQLILPPGWETHFLKGSGSTQVSWSHADSWLALFRHLGRAHDLQFLVNWDARRVVVAPASSHAHLNSAKNLKVVSGTAPKSGGAKLNIANAKKGQGRKWSLTRGKDLSAELTRWGKAAGWTVLWKTQTHFTVQASSTLYGSFLHVVREVMNSLPQTHPVAATAYKHGQNKTLVIHNGKNS